MGREHTGKDLRETPPRDSRRSGGVARMWVILVNLLMSSAPWEDDLCGLHHPGSLALWLATGFDWKSEG